MAKIFSWLWFLSIQITTDTLLSYVNTMTNPDDSVSKKIHKNIVPKHTL